MDKIFFMNEAINEAKKAYDKGETPIGAVIVKDSRVNVEFGIMEDECSIILQRFFKYLRKK